MRNLRTGSPPPEKWEVEDIIAHLSCDETTASEIMKECRSRHGIKDYGAIEKHLILDLLMRSSVVSESVKHATPLIYQLLAKWPFWKSRLRLFKKYVIPHRLTLVRLALNL